MKRTAPFLLILILASCPSGPASSTAKSPSVLEVAKEFVKKKDLAGATQYLEGIRDAQGTDPDLASYLAEVYQAQNDPAHAILRLREATEKTPDAAKLYLPLARIYMQVNDDKAARTAIEKARTLGGEDAEVSLLLGTCLARLSEFDGALREFERARAAGAKLTAVLYNEGLLSTQKKDQVRARELFEQVLAKDPNWSPAKRELARVMIAQLAEEAAQGKPVDRKAVNGALDLLESVREELKDDWRVAEAIGDGWLLLGDLDAAILSYTEALRLGQNPPSVEERYRAAELKRREQQKKSGKSPTPGAGIPPGGGK